MVELIGFKQHKASVNIIFVDISQKVSDFLNRKRDKNTLFETLLTET